MSPPGECGVTERWGGGAWRVAPFDETTESPVKPAFLVRLPDNSRRGGLQWGTSWTMAPGPALFSSPHRDEAAVPDVCERRTHTLGTEWVRWSTRRTRSAWRAPYPNRIFATWAR